MSYKDKVKKAMELSLRDQVLLKHSNSYLVVNSTSILCVGVDGIVFLEVNDSCLGFPHIETLQQFEDLYKALTGKELADD